MSDHNLLADEIAGLLIRQAAWPVLAIAIAAAGLVVGPERAQDAWPVWSLIASAVTVAAALATIALSLLLAFDALLFRLIASHRDEEAGCAAVDDLLVRMRLKPRPVSVRSLAERIAGTRRILCRQRAAFALFATTALIAGIARAA